MKIEDYHRKKIIEELESIFKSNDSTTIKRKLNFAAINYSKKDKRLGEIFEKQKIILFGD